MSFILSISFNLTETTYKLWVTSYFQFTFKTILKLTLNSPQNTYSFRLSLLSLLIHLLNETEKLLEPNKGVRKFMVGRRQDYTKGRSAQPAAYSIVPVYWNWDKLSW